MHTVSFFEANRGLPTKCPVFVVDSMTHLYMVFRRILLPDEALLLWGTFLDNTQKSVLELQPSLDLHHFAPTPRKHKGWLIVANSHSQNVSFSMKMWYLTKVMKPSCIKSGFSTWNDVRKCFWPLAMWSLSLVLAFPLVQVNSWWMSKGAASFSPAAVARGTNHTNLEGFQQNQLLQIFFH